MGVVWGVQGEDWLSTSKGVLAYLFGFAALFGVGDEKTVGKGGDVVVSCVGDAKGWPAYLVVEEGEEQEAPFGDGFLPTFRGPHIAKASGRAHDDAGRASQQEVQEFFFHGRVETANDGHVL